LPLLVLGAIALGHVGHAWRVNPSTDSSLLDAPGVSDLTIKTRQTIDRPNSTVTTEVVYLKGARQRRDTIAEWPPQVRSVIGAKRTHLGTHIALCDERRELRLNHEARTYAYMPVEASTEHSTWLRRAARRPQPKPTGGDVTITIDSVDTGERRQVGRYVARHVITTTRTEAGPGASTRSNDGEVDGWYIDLPPMSCSNSADNSDALLYGYVQPANVPKDRVHLKRLGTARRGQPIKETSRSATVGGPITSKLELIEFSDATLDDGLFRVPDGYRPALPRLIGGFDLTRPDTLKNRLESYWEELSTWVRRVRTP
jgi:hypothetical protein